MRRKLSVERLEQRVNLSGSDYLSDYVDIGQLDFEPTYTTVDSPTNHVTPRGTSLDGVVKLTIQAATGTFLGSGTLLPTGRHILTAAHNITGVDEQPVGTVSSIIATFELPTGDVTRSASLGSISVHPSWNGVLELGNDLAIIELTTDAPATVQRFDIFRATTELQSVGEKAGYGQSGQGVVTIGPGTKRDGQNRYELYLGNTQTAASVLLYDFDNGSSSNDTFGLVASRPNTGQGTDEVMTAPGDSGGPTFLSGRIAGVTSFRTAAASGDAVPGLNSSFGEIGGDTRVSIFASWIDAIIDVAGAPKVMNVTVSGSASIHAPFSFDTVDGSGLQLRTVPVGGANRVAVQFSEHALNVGAGSLTLTGLALVTLPQLATTGGFVYSPTTHVATWTFSAPLTADQYLISLADTVTDVAGNALDGEWTNPFSLSTTNGAMSEFPSGDGTAGGDFNFVMTILPGDANLSNWVEGYDYLILQANYGQTGRTFTQADFTGDGAVNTPDFSLFSANYGRNFLFLVYADFDGDGDVDNTDYSIWSQNFGVGDSHSEGDADGDGGVDGDDWAIWQRQQGLRLAWVA